jgi:hypothetical protein
VIKLTGGQDAASRYPSLPGDRRLPDVRTSHAREHGQLGVRVGKAAIRHPTPSELSRCALWTPVVARVAANLEALVRYRALIKGNLANSTNRAHPRGGSAQRST